MTLSLGSRLLLAAICAISVATVYAAQPMLAPIGADLDLPGGALGWVVTVGQIGYLLGLLFLVPLGDLVDRRKLIGAHLTLTAGSVIIAACATRPAMLLIGVGCAGLFAVVVQTTVAYTAAVSDRQERGRNLGFVTSGVVIGILGARLIAGLLATWWGWRSVYFALAAALLTAVVVAMIVLPADQRGRRMPYGAVIGSARRLIGERRLLSRGLIALFLFASFGTLWSGLALPLGAAPWGLSAAQIGLFGIAGLAGALGAGRAGRWADRGWGDRVTGVALLLLLLSWAGIAQATWSLWLLVAGIVVLDFAVQVVHVSNQHLITTVHPERTSSAIGSYMLFYSAGSAIGAAATTALYAVVGWDGSSALGAVFATLAIAVWMVDRRTTRQRDGQADPARTSA